MAERDLEKVFSIAPAPGPTSSKPCHVKNCPPVCLRGSTAVFVRAVEDIVGDWRAEGFWVSDLGVEPLLVI